MKDTRVQVCWLPPSSEHVREVQRLEIYIRLDRALARWRKYFRGEMPEWMIERHRGRIFIVTPMRRLPVLERRGLP